MPFIMVDFIVISRDKKNQFVLSDIHIFTYCSQMRVPFNLAKLEDEYTKVLIVAINNNKQV